MTHLGIVQKSLKQIPQRQKKILTKHLPLDATKQDSEPLCFHNT